MKNKFYTPQYALAALLLTATSALAQGMPDGPMVPAMPMPGGAGQARPMPRFGFAIGKVQAVNAANGTLIVAPNFGGAAMTIKVPAKVIIVTQRPTAVADLKVGDFVQVQGTATGLTASALTVGQLPEASGQMPGLMGNAGAMPAAAPGGKAAPQHKTFAPQVQARGQVSSMQPLTLSFGDGGTLTISIGPKARLSRITTIGLADVKAGDQIQATGPIGTDGVLSADTLSVNMGPVGGAIGGTMGGMMPMPGGF